MAELTEFYAGRRVDAEFPGEVLRCCRFKGILRIGFGFRQGVLELMLDTFLFLKGAVHLQ